MHATQNEIYPKTAKLFHILSHPARLQILDELRKGPACVCHLQAVLGRPQAYVSQQLRVLREAEVIDSTKDGLFIFYRLVHPQVEKLITEMLGSVGEREPSPDCKCPSCTTE